VSKIAALKDAKSLSDLAYLVGFTPSGLSYTLYKVPEEQKYKKFQIAKKNRGVREICAPQNALKLLQQNLATLLYDSRDELMIANPRRTLSHGFRRKQSIITNATPHKNRRFVLNLDLESFFPTFNFGRVRGFFLKDKDFALEPKVATVIAQIACFEHALPQGSPSSPVIADMVAHILDVRLVRLAKTHRVRYSRYAEDLTFSTNEKEFPSALAFLEAGAQSEWTLGPHLVTAINSFGFAINATKTRMQVRPSRQMVTGLTVNVKVNIPQDYVRATRSMCNSLFQNGAFHRGTLIKDAKAGASPYETLKDFGPLEGRLSHIHHVKRSAELIKDPKAPPKATPGRKLHAKFLFYKYFIAPSRPLIVCEGKTDNIYLKYALRHSANLPPQLGKTTEKGFEASISFFSYTNHAHLILELGGGEGHLKSLVSQFRTNLKRYGHRPLAHPIIVLVDNDTALSSIGGDLKKHFGVEVSLTSMDAFYHLTSNLYLVKTLELGAMGTSCIEDCFDTAIKSTLLEGKSFNPKKKLDPATEYGKAPFAEKVVVPKAGEIRWDNFAPLLGRIAAVIRHYVPPKADAVAKVAQA
jgi:RNA-directed DNA polymerase